MNKPTRVIRTNAAVIDQVFKAFNAFLDKK